MLSDNAIGRVFASGWSRKIRQRQRHVVLLPERPTEVVAAIEIGRCWYGVAMAETTEYLTVCRAYFPYYTRSQQERICGWSKQPRMNPIRILFRSHAALNLG
ncbi:hypothetical protein NKH89_28810 [Mesorhizobium sp. M0923]|uniref:hypothetical protein n=1 Tax=Mesorhizobium sp. M0923 TaxID=2957028 RepID=UPI00333D031B